MNKPLNKAVVVALLFFCTPLSFANGGLDFAGPDAQKKHQDALGTVRSLSKDIQALKADVVDLNKELSALEEELLFPSNTQCTVFVVVDGGQFFTLESIKLKLDGELVSSHVYSDKQRDALLRGGVQKLFLTNLSAGKHVIDAFFTGVGPNGRPYKRAATLEFTKGQVSQYLELKVTDNPTKQVPEFAINFWN